MARISPRIGSEKDWRLEDLLSINSLETTKHKSLARSKMLSPKDQYKREGSNGELEVESWDLKLCYSRQDLEVVCQLESNPPSSASFEMWEKIMIGGGGALGGVLGCALWSSDAISCFSSDGLDSGIPILL